MKKEKNATKGITLIALVITIIVLLILAGVTISTLTGENGILTKAQYAKRLTEEKEREEEEELYNIEEQMNELTTGDVPRVRDANPGVLEGEGTEEKPYEINSIEDLVAFSKHVNEGNSFSGKYVKLIKSLDFKSNNSYVDPETQEFGDVNLDGRTEGLKIELSNGQGFVPIGNYNSDPIPFSGTFYGNKKRVKNLYINVVQDNGEFDAGLFGYNTGTIQDLYVLDSNIYVESYVVFVGGIAGVQDGIVQRCVSSGKLIAKAKGEENPSMSGVGGIAGQSSAEGTNALIDSCYNLADVYSINLVESSDEKVHLNSNAGGIIAMIWLENQTVSNCYNKGTIYAESKQAVNVGGIISEIGGNSKVEMSSGETYSYGGNVENCYNLGNVNGKSVEEDNSEINSVGSAIGTLLGNAKINNVYGINNKDIIGYQYVNEEYPNVITNVEAKSIAELKSDELLPSLGSGFKKDTGINEGFPILAWQ